MLVSFGVGMMVGAAMHGGWGYGCCWGHSHGGVVVVNNHNNFVSHHNHVNHNNVNRGNSNWQHNPSHRGNTPYGNSDLSNKYGDRANANRPSQMPSNRPSQTPGVSDRRADTPGQGAQQRPAGDRPSAGTADRGAGAGNRGLDRAAPQPAGQGGGLGGAPALRLASFDIGLPCMSVANRRAGPRHVARPTESPASIEQPRV